MILARRLFLTAAAVVVASGAAFAIYGRSIWVPFYQNFAGKQTVEEVVARYGKSARARLRPHFDQAKVTYPPQRATFLAIKDEAVLELWAETDTGPRFIRRYSIQKLSGVSGPKLREGDRQVPEGIYRISGLNPNSAYHLSMKLNYPNAFDLAQAEAERRTQPGTNIFIHGKAVSIGCLAMGDRTIEELFVLAADMGRENITVVIAPFDPRKSELPQDTDPAWIGALYRELTSYFAHYPSPGH